MIRDPSDGSVRETTAIGIPIAVPKAASEVPVSGLPTGSQKPKNIARLEASRAWLKQYHERRQAYIDAREKQETT